MSWDWIGGKVTLRLADFGQTATSPGAECFIQLSCVDCVNKRISCWFQSNQIPIELNSIAESSPSRCLTPIAASFSNVAYCWLNLKHLHVIYIRITALPLHLHTALAFHWCRPALFRDGHLFSTILVCRQCQIPAHYANEMQIMWRHTINLFSRPSFRTFRPPSSGMFRSVLGFSSILMPFKFISSSFSTHF